MVIVLLTAQNKVIMVVIIVLKLCFSLFFFFAWKNLFRVNISCGYLLELLHLSDSIEHPPQDMFGCKSNKNCLLIWNNIT